MIMPTGGEKGASNPSYETRQGETVRLKILPAPSEIGVVFLFFFLFCFFVLPEAIQLRLTIMTLAAGAETVDDFRKGRHIQGVVFYSGHYLSDREKETWFCISLYLIA